MWTDIIECKHFPFGFAKGHNPDHLELFCLVSLPASTCEQSTKESGKMGSILLH